MANYEETFQKLTTLQHMMRAMRHHQTKQAGPLADTTRGRGRVLALLKMRDGLSTREMANVLDIRVSSLNETIARMEAEGLVERRQSEEDRRVQLLFLTDAGRAAEQPELDLPKRLFSDFTDEELQTLDSYLDRMCARLREELGDDWREHEEHMRQRRDKFFHSGGHGHGHSQHGSDHGQHGSGHGDHGHGRGGHGHGGRHAHGHRPHARYDSEAEREACDHSCHACTRSVCVRHQ